jgi:hypothetical protein
VCVPNLHLVVMNDVGRMNILPFEMWTYQGYQCLMFFFKKKLLKVSKDHLVLNLTLPWDNARF